MPTITAKQRDALHEQILIHLSGIEDVWIAVRSEDFETADRLGRDYSDDLCLLINDLGWGEGSRDAPIELTTPPDVLRRVFNRLRETAARQEADEATERAEAKRFEEQNRVVAEVCREVLTSLCGEGV